MNILRDVCYWFNYVTQLYIYNFVNIQPIAPSFKRIAILAYT